MKLSSDYLVKRVSLDDVMAKYDFKSCAPEFRADWERLLGKRIAGDELWCFAPPPGQIEVWGIALVRGDAVISTLVEAVG